MLAHQVTGKLEVHFSLLRRVGPYIVSVCVTGAMLALAFLVMLCSLNLQVGGGGVVVVVVGAAPPFMPLCLRAQSLQGYIKRDTSAFHIEFFADYAEPGALFDPNGHFAVALIPVVGHSMIILVLNYFYSSIAVYLTDKENHRTEAEYENALILKRCVVAVAAVAAAANLEYRGVRKGLLTNGSAAWFVQCTASYLRPSMRTFRCEECDLTRSAP